MRQLHFNNLKEYLELFGLPAPEHPLFSIITSAIDTTSDECPQIDAVITTDFYAISLKQILAGEIHYGRTKYDYQNGSLICLAPRQPVYTKGIKTKSNANTIFIHEEVLRGTRIQKQLENASYFNYAVNEALHLSPKEECLIKRIFDNIQQEYDTNHDAFSKDILISQLDTLLKYTDRFYRRQFQQRKEASTSIKDKFFDALADLQEDAMPTVEAIAKHMNMTPRYLSDGLKAETGKTAIENIHLRIIDQAKDLLLSSDETIAEIAYKLGFEYPQYFSRLFKNRVGMTPTQ